VIMVIGLVSLQRCRGREGRIGVVSIGAADAASTLVPIEVDLLGTVPGPREAAQVGLTN
jgi:hypothetical protein